MSKIWADNKRTVVIKEIVEVPTIKEEGLTTDIDSLLNQGLKNISRMMNVISTQAGLETFDRSTVQNLKDLMAMLGDLKQKETDLLAEMSDEELLSRITKE
jgi:hypothetical protein